MEVPAIKKKSTPWVMIIGVVGILGIGAIAFRSLTGTKEAKNIANLTVAVQPESLNIRIKASGSVQPNQTVNLSPRVAGQLAKLFVEQGDRVTKGQVVGQMDDRSIQTQIAQAEASLANFQATLERLRNGSRTEEIATAKARLASLVARRNLAQIRLDRNRDLAAQGAITRDRLDELSADAKTAAANVLEQQQQLTQLQNGSRVEDIAQAQAQVQEAQARLTSARVQQEDTLIRSPFDGIVTQKYSNVGGFVTPTTSASASSSATSSSIVAVANGLEILAKVPEVDVAQIKVGQKVEIIADAFPEQTFTGQVRLIAPEAVLEQNVTSFQVRVTLVTGKAELKSGMNTDLRFIGKRIDGALVVPTVAIATEKGQTGLYFPDENNKPQFRPVSIGITIDNKTQILKGVNSGELVFIKLPESKQPRPNN